ncbi:V-type proton ATPase subunit F 1-like [Phlebotomus papatasi]|uniref:V-type proton ATPase subunit F 1-like n=1 Tax=Phlebotomus papatasi TaxID=29031 RepID=UPI002483C6FE|nr:V-type proton ATPase subunit F 1-like [Phlebotomus papatasi]
MSRSLDIESLESIIEGKLISVIADEDTIVGFLLGGIGEINENDDPNFMVVDKETSVSEIEKCFKEFLKREDIDIILITQNLAELIRHEIDTHTSLLPIVLEIPSKDNPYEPTKDPILCKAKELFGSDDLGDVEDEEDLDTIESASRG